MEGAVGNAEEGLQLVVVAVFAVTLEESESSQEVSLLDEVLRVWQFELLLYAHTSS